MRLTVTGKHIDTRGVLRQHVEASLGAILGKYFKTAIEAHVVFSKEAHLCRAEVSFHIGRRIGANAGAVGLDIYSAFDTAAGRLAKQLRRYKRRLHSHHGSAREALEAGERADDAVIEWFEEAEDEPAIGAQADADLPTRRVPQREA